jgi:hypothetical protein
MNSQAYSTFRNAILAGRPVSFDYHGFTRIACPHVVGLKHGQEKVLTFQYAGGSQAGLPAGGQWRCIFINQVSNVRILERGAWHTIDSHIRPQSCIDAVDVEIIVDAYGNPVPYTRQA